MPSNPIVGTWQHRISPGVVPVIVSGYGRVPSDQDGFPSEYDLIMSGCGRVPSDQFDQDDSDEEFDTPIVVIHEDVGGES